MTQGNDLKDPVRVGSSVNNPADGTLKPVVFRPGETYETINHVFFGMNYSMQTGWGVLYFGRVSWTDGVLQPAGSDLR